MAKQFSKDAEGNLKWTESVQVQKGEVISATQLKMDKDRIIHQISNLQAEIVRRQAELDDVNAMIVEAKKAGINGADKL